MVSYGIFQILRNSRGVCRALPWGVVKAANRDVGGTDRLVYSIIASSASRRCLCAVSMSIGQYAVIMPVTGSWELWFMHPDPAFPYIADRDVYLIRLASRYSSYDPRSFLFLSGSFFFHYISSYTPPSLSWIA